MKLLVFQHIDCEHPGSLRQFLADDGVQWDAVNLHKENKYLTLMSTMLFG